VKNIANFLPKVHCDMLQKIKDEYLFAFGLISKLQHVVLMEIITYDGAMWKRMFRCVTLCLYFPNLQIIHKLSLLGILDEIFKNS
jgi:hypothetical protein